MQVASRALLIAVVAFGLHPEIHADPIAYVTNFVSDTISVVDAETNTVIDTIEGVGDGPIQVVFHPSGLLAYVTNFLPWAELMKGGRR